MRPIIALVSLLFGIGFNTAGLAEEDSFRKELLKNAVEQQLDEARNDNEGYERADDRYQDKVQRERDLRLKRQGQQAGRQQTADEHEQDNQRTYETTPDSQHGFKLMPAQEQEYIIRQGTYNNGTFVRCPVNKLRTEVVSDLPASWWQTPQIGELEDTRIQHIGGEATLVCAYRGYGGTVSVMRLPPEGATCEARRDGFSCY